MTPERTDGIIRLGLDQSLFTAAVILAAEGRRIVLHQSYGTLDGDPTNAAGTDTLFDLASLTKIIATTPCWMVLAAAEKGILDEPIIRWFPEAPKDKKNITPRLLLAHASGLPHWRPYYLCLSRFDHKIFVRDKILREPLVYGPGDGCLYSDLGFMLLGFILEIETGKSLDQVAVEKIFKPLRLEKELIFRPSASARSIAPTLQGETAGCVHDLNARALGEVSGHAGLFGTAKGVHGVMAELTAGIGSESGLFDGETLRMFAERTSYVPDTTRALGFDTPARENCSSGRFFSRQSLGHTGFTGTSAWADPTTGIVLVLLTNRAYMGEGDFRIKQFRPLVHDALMLDLGRT
ncbi:MAG: serine hydrolase domain-containing protein [Pseudomonadota bacterium]